MSTAKKKPLFLDEITRAKKKPAPKYCTPAWVLAHVNTLQSNFDSNARLITTYLQQNFILRRDLNDWRDRYHERLTLVEKSINTLEAAHKGLRSDFETADAKNRRIDERVERVMGESLKPEVPEFLKKVNVRQLM